MKFYATIRLDIRRIGAIRDGDKNIGNRIRVKVVKNKIAPPFKQTELDLLFGEGISFHGDLIDLGVANGIIDKSGSWMSYAGNRIGQGRENARLWLKGNPEMASEIEAKVREKLAPETSSENEKPAPETSSENEKAAPEAAVSGASKKS